MHRWVEHTGELELELEAETEEGIFAEALAALRELLADGPGEPAPPRTVVVEAADRAALLAEWVGELAVLAETEGFVPAGVRRLELDERRLEAEVEGELGEPPPLVKAATYHRLALEPRDDGWHGSVILDV